MLFYRLLLYLYPASWRAEYGGEMCAVFQSQRHGVFLWIETIADLITGAIAVHFDLLRQDLRYAGRTFGRSPGFALTAVAIAAAGIGATTAAFTMVDHVLIRPLPFAHQERLLKLYEDHPLQSARTWPLSPANFRDWKNMNHSFETLAAYRGLQVNITGQGAPQSLEGASLTFEILPMLGVQPQLGRYFSREDDQDGASGTVILSHTLWTSLFGSDPSVLGRKIYLYETPYTVIGVMPKGFYFPDRTAQLWTAMRFGPGDFQDRTDYYINAIGLMKAGLPLAQVQADMTTVSGRLAKAYPKELAETGATLVPIREDVSTQSLMMLKVLLGAAMCVLLIACANLANLLLARAMVRRRELSVRTALGAGRERLIRQMLTESLILAFAGGALGVLIAYAALPFLVRLVPVALPIAEVPPIDVRVLTAALVVTLLTGICFGIIPALRMNTGISRSNLNARSARVRAALVVAEVAGSVVLLVGAGLLTRALWKIQAVNPGFNAERVLTLRTSLPIPRYQKSPERERFYSKVLGEARQLPGVTNVAYISFLPMVNRGGIWPVAIDGRPQEPSKQATVSLRFVTPGFFSALGIPMIKGRDVTAADTNNAPYVALVSQSFVRRHFPNEDPLGRRILVGNNQRVVIGVVGDIRVRGLERSSEPQVYASWLQPNGVSPWYSPKDLVVRGTAVESLAPALRRIIHEADPNQPVSDVRMMTEIVDGETASRRVQLGVLGAFGAVAFLLAAVGIHGLLSFAVASRTQEIGVRMALGAGSGDIMRMTLREGSQMAVAGIAIGSVLAYGAARLLASLLAGIQPDDLLSFSAAIILALVMTIAGSLPPALRAVRIDPTVALRAD